MKPGFPELTELPQLRSAGFRERRIKEPDASERFLTRKKPIRAMKFE
jgi:hypothetical protein